MTDIPPLPPVYKQTLDPESLRGLLDELEQCATILEVRQRRGRDASPLQLADVPAAMAQGTRVQIRYEHEGKTWNDTLMPGEEGVTLVRIQQQ